MNDESESDKSRPDEYRPIACEQYDVYEIAIMHAQNLRLKWAETENCINVAEVVPLQLETCNKEEFLVFRVIPNDETRRVRLDRISVIS